MSNVNKHHEGILLPLLWRQLYKAMSRFGFSHLLQDKLLFNSLADVLKHITDYASEYYSSE